MTISLWIINIEAAILYKNIWHYDQFIMDYYWMPLDYTKLFNIMTISLWIINIGATRLYKIIWHYDHFIMDNQY